MLNVEKQELSTKCNIKFDIIVLKGNQQLQETDGPT